MMKSLFQKYGGFLFVLVGVVGLFFFEFGGSTTSDVVLITSASNLEETVVSTQDKIYVDIKGAVVYPGVYYCTSNMRIADVVMLAGGLQDEADTEEINLSKTLYDQMVIYIPYLNEDQESETSTTYFVDIKGAVLLPSVYEVKEGSRIVDVIQLAGGLLVNADITGINLSQKIVDEMVIFIPYQSDDVNHEIIAITIEGAVQSPGTYLVKEGTKLLEVISLAGGVIDNADITGMNWNEPLNSAQTIIIPLLSGSLEETEESLLVNINTASLEQLMTLNGIGIILGQRIIDYRAENGYFDSIEDVMNVSGIKESIYGQIKDDITV